VNKITITIRTVKRIAESENVYKITIKIRTVNIKMNCEELKEYLVSNGVALEDAELLHGTYQVVLKF
jgi:hypothetical protein